MGKLELIQKIDELNAELDKLQAGKGKKDFNLEELINKIDKKLMELELIQTPSYEEMLTDIDISKATVQMFKI